LVPRIVSQNATHVGFSGSNKYVVEMGGELSAHTRFVLMPGQTTDQGSSVVVVVADVLVLVMEVTVVDVSVTEVEVIVGRIQNCSLPYTIQRVDSKISPLVSFDSMLQINFIEW
jgi:hypothetical protein